MSYASVFRSIPEFIGQPAGIAALASLGIHGAIALILPLVPVNTAKPEKQANAPKPVGVTALSPKEQARLPQNAIASANPLQANLNPMAVQPGIPSQLPPMPNFSSDNSASLPPLPALGASATSVGGLPPLPKSTGVDLSRLPRGQRFNPSTLNIDTGFGTGSAIARSNFPRNFSTPSMGSPIAMRSRPGVSSNLPSMDTPGRVPIDTPPPMSDPLPEGVPAGMAPQNGHVATGVESGVNIDNNQEFVTPTGPGLQQGGALALGTQPVGTTTRPEGNNTTQDIDSALNNPSGINPNQPGNINPAGSPPSTINRAMAMASHSQKVRQNHPQLVTGKPINVAMDRGGLQKPVDVALVVKADGTIDDFEVFAEDGKPLSFEDSSTLRQFLAEYLKRERPAKTGRPTYLTINVTPKSGNAANPTQNNNPATNQPLTNTPLTTINNNRENNREASGNNSPRPISGFEVIRENSTPVNSPSNNTSTPDLPEPSFSEPVRLRQPQIIPTPNRGIENQTIPANNQQNRSRLLQTSPRTVQPAGETASPRINTWRDKLNTNTSDSNNQESSGIQKLREIARTRNQSNNSNP